MTVIGKPLTRVDGRARVTGGARYAVDFNQNGQAYAVIVSATVGLGHIVEINSVEVGRMQGVIAVFDHRSALHLTYGVHKSGIDPAIGERLHVLQDDRIRFCGQPVAVVVADTLDQADRAAAALRVTYAAGQPIVKPSDPRARAIIPDAAARPGSRIQADKSRGQADDALAQAPVKVDATYDMAREHHSPMEPHATVAAWDGDRLTLWSKTQFVHNEQAEIAAIFGIPVENVLVICPFIGGAFGTTLRTWPHVTLAAMAARHSGRAVKLVLTRKQMFFMTGHRPRALQRVALGASPDGRLTGLIHEGTAETSRYEQYIEALTAASGFMYSCPNVRTRYRLLPMDIGTPTFMRGPGEASGIFALECAMDELSHVLGVDPIELRRRNEPAIDQGENKPFSSRSILKCYEIGAERFGWSRRDPRPRSMRDGRLLIGMGVASATFPARQRPSDARVRLLAEGMAEVEVAASDMGPGTYTSMTQVAAEVLGLPVEQVRVSLGRSDYPTAPPHGGSLTMASVGSAVRAACIAARNEAARHAVADPRSPVFGTPLEDVEWNTGRLRRRGDGSRGLPYRDIVSVARKPIEAAASTQHDPDVARRYSMHAFGAIFVEVAVDPDVGTIGVRRAIGAYGTAASSILASPGVNAPAAWSVVSAWR
jgi:xanthine dehydrogenase YagR molybdenum-binding subunit